MESVTRENGYRALGCNIFCASGGRKRREIFAENIRNLENNVPKKFSPAARFGLDPMLQGPYLKVL